MKKSVPPFWQKFQVIAWVVGGLTALGTVVVVSAKYIELPKSVEAATQTATEAKKTAEQVDTDFRQYLEVQNRVAEALDGYVAQQQQQMPNQAAPPPARVRNVWEEQNPDGSWWCCDAETSDCNDPYSPPWYRCD